MKKVTSEPDLAAPSIWTCSVSIPSVSVGLIVTLLVTAFFPVFPAHKC